jgi:hypothetical protein
MKIVLVGAIIVGAIIWLWRYLAAVRRRKRRASSFALPAGVIINSAPLLLEEEVALYNLLRMVVQERYLVFTQVPLWSFVSVETTGPVHSQVMRHMALKRVDFALVHPGSRQVEQVVQIEQESPHLQQIEQQHVIESVLDSAGIKLMTLQAKRSYSLPDLAARLGLTEED